MSRYRPFSATVLIALMLSLATVVTGPTVIHAQAVTVSASPDVLGDSSETEMSNPLAQRLLSLIPQWIVAPFAAGPCECVKFIENLMNWRRIGGYPTAASMATRSYWYRAERGWRYQLNEPKQWEFVIATPPYWGTGSAGHIARVVSRPVRSGDNWVFDVEHANWGTTDTERRQGYTKANCSNVKTTTRLSAPRTGNKITFWGK